MLRLALLLLSAVGCGAVVAANSCKTREWCVLGNFGGHRAWGHSAWQTRCQSFDSWGSGFTIRVQMGEVFDYFRTRYAGERLCNVLKSWNRHKWSNRPDGGFRQITYFNSDGSKQHGGGSGGNYPLANVFNDDRQFISFWGHSSSKGGCCSSSYSTTNSGWGQSFVLSVWRSSWSSRQS